MPLSREEFIAAASLKQAEREIKGLGKVAVRQFSSREQAYYLEMRKSEDHHERARAAWWLLAQCILERPHGERMFKNEEIELLGSFSGEIIDALLVEITRLSDADPEAVERAGESFGETSGPASGSVSPSPTESRPES